MRSVRYSKTFTNEFEILLDQDEPKCGAAVIAAKMLLVRSTIANHLAHFPATSRLEPEHGVCVRAVRRTPFVLLDDFDDAELRIHMVVHKNSDRAALDPFRVEW